MKSELIKSADYMEFLNDLKERIRAARKKAVLSVNRELISLYWDIGKHIVGKQESVGWGKGVVEQLSGDLRREFPDVKGFSASNMWRMRAFYLAYRTADGKLAQDVRENVGDIARAVRDNETGMPEILSEIPWGHNVVLVEKVKDIEKRLWYAEQAVINGWSRSVLVHQIETILYERQKAVIKSTNFSETLPSPYSEMIEQAIKDPIHI